MPFVNGQWTAFWYRVNNVGASIATALFAVVTLWYIYQMWEVMRKKPVQNVKSKKKIFYLGMLIPFVIGALFETFGYPARMVSGNHPTQRGAYIAQTLLLLISPPFFAGSIYMAFGRLVLTLDGGKHSIVKTKFMTKFFVSGDILSLLVQAAGGSIMTSKNLKNITKGQNILIGGLAIQLFFFGFFMVTELSFYLKMIKEPTAIAIHNYNYPTKTRNWKAALITLFNCSILIMVRSVYRVVEFVERDGSYVSRKEWLLYVFDTSLMWLSCVLFTYENMGPLLMDIAGNLPENYEEEHESILQEVGADTEATGEISDSTIENEALPASKEVIGAGEEVEGSEYRRDQEKADSIRSY